MRQQLEQRSLAQQQPAGCQHDEGRRATLEHFHPGGVVTGDDEVALLPSGVRVDGVGVVAFASMQI